MKVRGKRNRAKLHARHVHAYEAMVRVEQIDGFTARLVVDPIFGTHLIRSKTIRDGYGRVVKGEAA